MRKAIRRVMPLLFVIGLSSLLATGSRAQDQDQDQSQDPPSRVGRLNYTQGSVSYQVQGDADWVAADPNRPLTTGDNLWADRDSRGEVHIDSTAIRLSSETGLSFLNLDDRTVQLQLPQGRIEVHLRQLTPGDAFEVDTPNLAFTLERAGEYMIATDPDGNSTTIIVREGEGQVTGGGDSWDITAGQQYTFDGTDQLSYDAEAAPDFDDFEAWCQSRDQRENESVSAQYVSRDVDGYYDLDEYGDWSQDSDYGPVWYPRDVDADWVPYHVGHWIYIAPWGWTWVDEEPWGFAPFHYGRWVLVGGRWGWVPGPRVVRPVYAPALVGFVGGPHFALSVSFGGGFTGVAWFPLGPRDVFVPTYHCSPHYVQYVNVTNTRVVNVTQVTNVYNTVIVHKDVTRVNYTYADNHRAVTVVSRDTFVNARPVAHEAVHVNDEQFRNARPVSSASIEPVRTSYVAANAEVVSQRPAVPFSQRPVVARLQPRVPVEAHPAPPMQNRGAQTNTPNGTGFRSFERPGNNGRGQLPESNNGRVQPPPTNNTMPATNNGARNIEQGQAAAPPNHRVEPSPQPRVFEEQGTPRNDNPPANNNPGFRPFNAPRNGNAAGAPNNSSNAGSANQPSPRNDNMMRSNNSPRGNNPPAQIQQNNNQERYRFSPPVRARDENYDVHPPLNQNRNESQPRPQPQPRPQQVQPRPEPHQPPPAHENRPSSPPNHDNNRH